MGKLLWNVVSAILFVANLIALAYSFLVQTALSGVILLTVVIIDAVYTGKHPTWLEI